MSSAPTPAAGPGPAPDFVVVGNVARDIVPGGGWQAGGTALYAACTALGLGRTVGVVTAAGADVLAALPLGIMIAHQPAAVSTTFENRYGPAGRTQFLRAVGEPIRAASVPASWRDSRIVLLGPVFHEAGAAVAARFAGLLGVCAQGFLRRVGTDERVAPLPPDAWDAAPLLARARVLFLSREDVGGDAAVVARWAALVPVLVVTDGAHGATVYEGGRAEPIAAAPARELDPTGAGDTFAAAFLIALDEGQEAVAAARFAAAVASLEVEQAGPLLPERAAVAARLAASPAG